MNLARILCLTLGLSAIAACGGSLEETCQESCDRVCDGEDARTAGEIAECKSACTVAAENAKTTGCEDEADKVQSCGDDHACDATVNTQCRDEITAYANCAADYCLDHPDSEVCAQ